MKINNPGDVRSIKPPIRLEKHGLIVDANDVIVARLETDDPVNDLLATDSKPSKGHSNASK